MEYGVDIWFSNKTTEWDWDKIPSQIDVSVGDSDICEMLYIIDTDSPIIREAQEITIKKELKLDRQVY